MNSEFVHVDMRQFNGMVNAMKMTNAEAKKAVKGGLRKGAQVIQKQARKNLKGVVNQASGRPLKSRNLTQFVRVTVYKNAKGARVDILPDKRKSTKARLKKRNLDNRSYIIRFFSTGTKERYTKGHRRYGQGRKGITWTGKGGYRGRIADSGFFADAVYYSKAKAEQVIREAMRHYFLEIRRKRK